MPGLSRRKQAIYRPLVKRAFEVYQERGGRDPQEPWYRRELVAAVDCYTTKQITTEDEFDAACLHFATIAGEDKQIEYWTRAPERRALNRLKRTMQNAEVDLAYVQGIARNMGFDMPLDEMPAALILKLNAAVYLHMKRKQKKATLTNEVPF